MRTDHRDGRVDRRIATPREMCRLEMVRIVRREIGLPGDKVKMRRKTRPGVRLKHPVGERVLFGHLPIRVDLRPRNERVRKRRGLAWVRVDDVPAIHFAVVVLTHERAMLMVDIGGKVKIDGMKRNRPAVAHPGCDGIGAGEAVEEIVDRPVFLNDDHDVLDLRRLDCGVDPPRGRASNRRRLRRAAEGDREAEQDGSESRVTERFSHQHPILYPIRPDICAGLPLMRSVETDAKLDVHRTPADWNR